MKEELSRMQTFGVILPVEEPTQSCAGMVVVPKPSGAVRICVDYRQLNESVLREVHPLPKVDATLAQLAGATIFSKVVVDTRDLSCSNLPICLCFVER